jgi:hypothetical protein
MSGFLQRLASSVLHARSELHPSSGTIGSAARMTGPAPIEWPGSDEPVESPSEVRAPRPQRHDDAPASPPPPPPRARTPPERKAAVSDETGSEDADQPAIAEAVALQPLVARPPTAASTPPPGSPAAISRRSDAGTAPRDPATAPEPADMPRLDRVGPTRPPAPAPRVPARAAADAGKAPSFLPSSQRRARPAQSVAEAPDSIEIHIGRIEVLAAPSRPAQQPPAPPPPERKSLDLREYLRREPRSR